jgi:hypothetical protein
MTVGEAIHALVESWFDRSSFSVNKPLARSLMHEIWCCTGWRDDQIMLTAMHRQRVSKDSIMDILARMIEEGKMGFLELVTETLEVTK